MRHDHAARWPEILAALPGTAAEVARELGLRTDTVRRDLRRMRHQGLVDVDPRGGWVRA